MGEWYDVGLQAGKKVAKAVDDFIASEHRGEGCGENFDPNSRKVLSDGSTVYRWGMKWCPSWYEDEKRFVAVLQKFDDDCLDEEGEGENTSSEYYDDTAYKLVAVGDEGGRDEMCNEAGCEIFDGLYHSCGVTFPDEWYDKTVSEPKKDVISVCVVEKETKPLKVEGENIPISFRTVEAVFKNEDKANEYIKLRKAAKDRDDRGCTFKVTPWFLQDDLM